MSRTYRNVRPKFRLGSLEQKLLKNGKAPDGFPTHSSASCERHGGCPYCLRNRQHRDNKRKIDIKDELL